MLSIILYLSGERSEENARLINEYLTVNYDISSDVEAANISEISSVKSFNLDGAILVMTITGFVASLITIDEKLEVRDKLNKLAKMLEEKLTKNGDIVWISIGDIPYPLQVDKIEPIIDALEKESLPSDNSK